MDKIVEEIPSDADTTSQCVACMHYQEDQWETGYCRLKRMYVLQSFSCEQFKQREANSEVTTQP